MALRAAFLYAPLAALLWACPASAQLLELHIGLTTGNVQIHNPNASSVLIDGYSIDSLSSSLLPAGWLSVTDNYDADSGGLLDPVSDWFILSQTTGSLAEGALLTVNGGALAAGESLSLGSIWSTTGVGDLTFEYVAGQTKSSSTPLYFFEADINRSGVVSASDYVLWRDSVSNPAAVPAADVNGDGAIDNADLLIWQEQFGGVSPASLGAAAVSSVVVPEPSALLLATASLPLLTRCRRAC